MTKEEREKLYKQCIDKWGADDQIMMMLEEMAELANALCKSYRGRGTVDAITTEIADVTIMVEQLRLIFGKDNVDKEIERKLDRLANRLQKQDKGK